MVRLADEIGCEGLKVAGIAGDDVIELREHIEWDRSFNGELLGAHAYLGAEPIVEAIRRGADVVVTGCTADSALFSAEAVPILDPDDPDALAGATTVGHLLECTGHLTGGNFEAPVSEPLSAEDYADLGYPLAKVMADGSAEIGLLDDARGRIDELNCTLQLLYEVHDPSAYITPDVVIDFTGIRLEQLGPNRVRVSGARSKGRPTHLKVSGFVEEPGFVADVEMGLGGSSALERARIAADALRLRLSREFSPENLLIDLVGVNSIHGDGSLPAPSTLGEARVHVSARCPDAESAQAVEDEVFAMGLSGPAGGGSFRSEKRPNLAVINGLIDRKLVQPSIVWQGAS